METKTDITKAISVLRKYGFTVKVFQGHKKIRAGSMSAMTDLLILGFGKIIFAEIKTKSTRDKLSKEQLLFKQQIKLAEVDFAGDWNVRYYELDEYNTNDFIGEMLEIAKCKS